jgi:signal transduction histidine kinase
MNRHKLFYSFRVRLLLLLAALLVATLGVQYYLNRRAQRETARLVSEQEKALAESIALGIKSISSAKYMYELEEERGRSLLEENRGHVTNVLTVNGQGRVEDSLAPDYMPGTLDGGAVHYYHVSELDLPEFAGMEVPEEMRRLAPQAAARQDPVAGEARSIPVPVETSRGPTYIIVVVGPAEARRGHSHWEDIEPLLPTLGVLLAAMTVAQILVWRFTQPITELSAAAHRVSAGDFGFRVPVERRDEVGALAASFNDMIAGLRRTRELEEQLVRAERTATVGRLAAAVAHEIKNPLNYINLALDHLRTTVRPQDEGQRGVFTRLTDQVKSEVARINTRIMEFLRYSRPAALELKPLDLRAIVEESARMIEMEAAEKGVETAIEQKGDMPAVRGDAESLRSVFSNLLINALHATEGGGEIKVELSGERGRVRVRVSDTGAGIPPEHLPQVFEPYFSTKETGTGLGLAIVKKAVEEHGGTIAVESRGGEGTTFTVTLPAAAGAPEGTQP